MTEIEDIKQQEPMVNTNSDSGINIDSFRDMICQDNPIKSNDAERVKAAAMSELGKTMDLLQTESDLPTLRAQLQRLKETNAIGTGMSKTKATEPDLFVCFIA